MALEPNKPAVHDTRFRKSERLLKRREFKRAQRGKRFVTPTLIVIASPSKTGVARLGVVVSKKVGNSVVRSRVKRRLREAFRRNKAALPTALDLVWIARSEAAEASYATLLDDALRGSQHAGRGRRKKRSSPSAT